MREFAKFCSPMAIGAAASRVQEQSSTRGGRNTKTNQAHIAASVAAKKKLFNTRHTPKQIGEKIEGHRWFKMQWTSHSEKWKKIYTKR